MEKKSITGIINEETKKQIYSLLTELKNQGEVFNQMGGALYSAIIADKMTEINRELYTKYGVKVDYWQPRDGRVAWINLDELINKYKVEE